ncbi:MAG TPA: nuclear transport factor 2 family protein [Gemmatimonadaceae bacterium]
MITSLLLSLALGAPPAPAPSPAFAPALAAARSDSADVAATVARFHEALAAGDSGAALALLQPHVVILESGGVERLADYRAHHLPADIEFARAVPSVRVATAVRVAGDAAWASGTSVTQGEFRGRAINSVGAELMVLERTPQGWRIAAIHWSSRARRG